MAGPVEVVWEHNGERGEATEARDPQSRGPQRKRAGKFENWLAWARVGTRDGESDRALVAFGLVDRTPASVGPVPVRPCPCSAQAHHNLGRLTFAHRAQPTHTHTHTHTLQNMQAGELKLASDTDSFF